MTTQRNVTFEKFNDGIVAICEIDDDGNAGTQKEKLRFSEKTVVSENNSLIITSHTTEENSRWRVLRSMVLMN